MSVHVIGIGRSKAMGGTTVQELLDELEQVRRDYGAPGDARIAPTAPGSTYAAEVIWSDGLIPGPKSAHTDFPATHPTPDTPEQGAQQQ